MVMHQYSRVSGDCAMCNKCIQSALGRWSGLEAPNGVNGDPLAEVRALVVDLGEQYPDGS